MAELTWKNISGYAGRVNALSDANSTPLCGLCTEPPAMSELEEFKKEMRASMQNMITAVAEAKARPTRKPSPGEEKPGVHGRDLFPQSPCGFEKYDPSSSGVP